MQKVLFIVGPTGVGKTTLALKIAKKYNGELVSADSVQVFKTLDIVSGKDLPKGYTFHAGYYSSNSSPSIHLLDVVNPTKPYSVSDFHRKATSVISDISRRGKLPIVVGGSGLYVEVLLNGLHKGPEPDAMLRSKLEKMEVTALQKLIPKVRLEQMNNSDMNNKRRLIRAIEILKNKSIKHQTKEENYDRLVIGLTCERSILKERIDKRVEDRLKRGALMEVRKLFIKYNKLSPQVKDANGYRQLFSYLKKEVDLEEAIERWKISEYRHAKNQMTWFRKYGDVKWYNIMDNKFAHNLKNSLKPFVF